MTAVQDAAGARRTPLTLAALAAAALLALAAPARAASMADGKFRPGDQAADFTLQDTAGNSVTLSQVLEQDVVLLAFFAMRCGTCLAEAPYLEQIHDKFDGKGMRLLAVNTDGVSAEVLAETLKSVGVTMSYTVLLDPEFAVSDAYTNFVVPLTLVIDRAGVVRYVHSGFETGVEKEYEKALRAAMGS